MHNHGDFPAESLFLIPAVAAAAAYWAGTVSGKSGAWPYRRLAFFLAGVLAVLLTVLEPLSGWAHQDFGALALSHVLAGMAGPALLVLAHPVELALRTLDSVPAARLRRTVNSPGARFLVHPVTATVLVAAGMWAMFHTPLLPAMQQSMPVHWLVTAYLVTTGCLFTAAVLDCGPVPHSLRLRAGALAAAAAVHAGSAAWLLVFPPAGSGSIQPGALVLLGSGLAVQTVLALIMLGQQRGTARLLPSAYGA
ncbi:cytochrome c oxidase assembly protein [Arthrobacter koreensis]|uniref:cytochrome c oxidase assembly protein n=1 Tax=Arthrobacter koreensis TaxID=199136 RepID=UPI002DB6F99C|nr:cytochrome c oxidase assembly protein [Arthrobacter koreensis]MEB7503884.1 cytochrome c oxidase assembly protein [Arthrobacter koreensis]